MAAKEKKLNFFDYFSFGSGSVGTNLATTMCGAFLTVYLTDTIGISAAIIGTIILILRFSDGASDLVMGYIVDRTRTRFGKARPWIIVGGIGTAISLYLVFNIPTSWSMLSKTVYFAAIYALLMVVFATISSISITSMLPLITRNPKNRTVLGASTMGATIVTAILATVGTVSLIKYFGDGPDAYGKTAMVYAVITLLTASLAFGRLREQNYETPAQGDPSLQSKPDKVRLKDALKTLTKIKYFFLTCGAGLLVNLNNAIIMGAGIYFCRDVLGDVALFSLFSIVTLVPVVLGIPVAVMLANKFGKHAVLSGGMLISILGVTLAAVAVLGGTPNVVLLFVGHFIAGIGRAGFSGCFHALLADISDYAEWKSGLKMQGIIFSAESVGIKAGAGLGAGLLGWVLFWAAYDGSATVQSAQTISALKTMFAVTPILCYVGVFLCLFFCNLEKISKTVREELSRKNDSVTL